MTTAWMEAGQRDKCPPTGGYCGYVGWTKTHVTGPCPLAHGGNTSSWLRAILSAWVQLERQMPERGQRSPVLPVIAYSPGRGLTRRDRYATLELLGRGSALLSRIGGDSLQQGQFEVSNFKLTSFLETTLKTVKTKFR